MTWRWQRGPSQPPPKRWRGRWWRRSAPARLLRLYCCPPPGCDSSCAALVPSMGLGASSRSGSGSSNPSAVPALLERHAALLSRFAGEEAVAVGDPFWCVDAAPRRAAPALMPLRRPAFLAFPDLLTRFRPEDVEYHLSSSCGALGACPAGAPPSVLAAPLTRTAAGGQCRATRRRFTSRSCCCTPPRCCWTRRGAAGARRCPRKPSTPCASSPCCSSSPRSTSPSTACWSWWRSRRRARWTVRARVAARPNAQTLTARAQARHPPAACWRTSWPRHWSSWRPPPSRAPPRRCFARWPRLTRG